MKKFISTISILSIVIFTNSCREQDEDFETPTSNKEQTNEIFKRTTANDSIRIDSTGVVASLNEGDPPPRNGHQW